MKKYITIIYQPTGSCWVNYFEAFDTQEEAKKRADEKSGIVIYTDFFYKAD